MSRRKILEIIPTLDQSGAEKQLVLLAAGLPRDRFEVEVAVLTRSGPLEADLRDAEIPVTLIGKGRKFSPSAFFRLKRTIRRFRPDLVHTWLFAANAYGRKAAIDCGVPSIVCGERCVDPWKRWWHHAIDRRLAKKTDVIAVNSEGIRDFYVGYGLAPEKFAVIPNAAVPLPASPLTRRELLAEMGIEPTGEKIPFLIGMVARLWPQKRVREAIWSTDQLKFTGVDFHLVIIGDGPQRDELLRYRDELRLTDRCHFIGHRSDVFRWMSHFDLVWNTSAYEGQSNTILEAMSAGVPVVASDIPGNRELVVPGKTGLLIPEYDGDLSRRRTAFCRESFLLLRPENEEKRRAMGDAAKKRIAEEFSGEKMISRYAELYQNLIHQKTR